VRDAGVKPDLRVAPDSDRLARAAADAIAHTAAGAVARRGRFTLVLAGGDTPRATYRHLAARRDIDWARADIFFGDERAVARDDMESNYRSARDALLGAPAVVAARVHPMTAGGVDLEHAAQDYEAVLRRRAGSPPRLDIVLLGLGDDGHTASLFPDHAALAERRRWVVATPAPRIASRLTLTYAAFAAARHVFFLVAGATKASILRRVLRGPRDPHRFPAQGIRPRRGRIVWFVDRAAWPP
jgi:6-phosphogluconolactonase